MKRNRKTDRAKKAPAFVARAERAFRRVARKVRAENRKLGLRPVVWPNGNVKAKPLHYHRLRGSLKHTKAMDVFMSERRRERAINSKK